MKLLQKIFEKGSLLYDKNGPLRSLWCSKTSPVKQSVLENESTYFWIKNRENTVYQNLIGLSYCEIIWIYI